jgi:ligand-binding SRPBCC domain-containing protein
MTITVSTDLPITAEHACQLAQKPALLNCVLWPWLSATPCLPLPEPVTEGDEILVRLRFLGFLPGWTHTIRIERLAPQEIVTCEHGGPVKTWDHRLTFEPTSPHSCRYTDTVKVRAGLGTPLTALFAHLIYRYRQARWRALAQVFA